MSPRARKYLIRAAWVVPVVAVLGVIAILWVRGTYVGKLASGLGTTTRLEWLLRQRWYHTRELPPGDIDNIYVVETDAAFVNWLNSGKEYLWGTGDSANCPLFQDGAHIDPWGTPFRVIIKRSGFPSEQGSDDIAVGSITVESAGPDRDFSTTRDNLRSW